MKKPTESALVKACLELLHLRGIFAWRQNQGVIPLPGGGFRRFVGLRGLSDIVGLLPPAARVLCVECKMPDGVLSPEQKAFLDRVRQLGGLSLVVRSIRELEIALDQERL